MSPQLRGPLFTELTHRSRPPGAGRKVWGEDPGQAGAWGLPGGGGLEEAREGFTPHPASPPPTAHSGTPPHTHPAQPHPRPLQRWRGSRPPASSARGRAVPRIMAPVGTQPLGQPPGTASSQRSRGRALAERRGPSAPPEACSSPTHPRGRYRPGRRPQSRGLPTPVSGSPGSLMGKPRPRGLRSQSRASAETEGSVSSFHHRGR